MKCLTGANALKGRSRKRLLLAHCRIGQSKISIFKNKKFIKKIYSYVVSDSTGFSDKDMEPAGQTSIDTGEQDSGTIEVPAVESAFINLDQPKEDSRVLKDFKKAIGLKTKNILEAGEVEVFEEKVDRKALSTATDMISQLKEKEKTQNKLIMQLKENSIAQQREIKKLKIENENLKYDRKILFEKLEAARKAPNQEKVHKLIREALSQHLSSAQLDRMLNAKRSRWAPEDFE
ncbi:Hypothetical predicted protein, partial [Cloeon dipterum]